MDVSGTMQLKLQQSTVEFFKVLSFSSSTEWWIFWLRDRDRYGAVLGLVGTPVVVQRQVLGFIEQKTVDVPQLQFLDKAVVCPLLYNAEARGGSTGAVLGQVVTCPLL